MLNTIALEFREKLGECKTTVDEYLIGVQLFMWHLLWDVKVGSLMVVVYYDLIVWH